MEQSKNIIINNTPRRSGGSPALFRSPTLSQRPGHFKFLIMRQAKNQKNSSISKSELPIGTRRIKIQPKFVQRTYDNNVVPAILLTGEWLRKIGFECEGYVLIKEEGGGLVIRLEVG